jgi:hypothetical protein
MLAKVCWQARAYARSIEWSLVIERFETLLKAAFVRNHAAHRAVTNRRGMAV